jgi:glycosyltransferase involved in cell wall biosynthesis
MTTDSSSITVVIPCRLPVRADVTLNSLNAQTCRDFQIVIIPDKDGRGAPWARNQGLRAAQTEFVLFSDDDIYWKPHALQSLLDTLRAHPEASYSYGAYEMGSLIQCDGVFDPERLKGCNYISTMSLVRRTDAVEWDESLTRLQDWDYWLTMLERGKTGASCARTIFSTIRRNGITYGSAISWKEAERIVRQKHGL